MTNHTQIQISWEVALDDGAVIRQSDGNLYMDLPLNRVRRLRAVVEGFPFDVTVPEGCEPIYGYLVTKQMEFFSGEEASRKNAVVLGWRNRTKGDCSIMYLYDDGYVELSQRDFEKDE